MKTETKREWCAPMFARWGNSQNEIELTQWRSVTSEQQATDLAKAEGAIYIQIKGNRRDVEA